MQFFSHHSSFKEKLTSLFAHRLRENIFTRIFNRLFHRQDLLERAHIRKVIIIYLLLFTALTTAFAFSYSRDLLHFSQTYKGFAPSPDTLTLDSLATELSSVYATSSYSSWLGDINKYSGISLILLTTITSLYLFFRHWSWRVRKVIKHLVLLFAFQLFYLAPITILVYVPDSVISKLLTQSSLDISDNIKQIESQGQNLGLVLDPSQIITQIGSATTPPTLTIGDFGKGILKNYLNISTPDTFYRARISPHQIDSLASVDFSHRSILFPSGRLSISPSVAKDDLGKILEALAIKTFQTSSYSSHIKDAKNPTIQFLTEIEYNDLENKKLLIEQQKIEKYLSDISKDIIENQRYIVLATNDLASLKSDKDSYQNRVNPLLAECLSLYGESDCLEAKNIIASTLAEYDQVIANVESNLATANSYIPSLERAQSNAKRTLANFLAFPIIPELQAGIFEPPSSILIKYAPANYLPENYFYILLHELAHFYSSKSSGDQPSFLEEGITDFLSLSVGGTVVAPTSKIDGYRYEIQIANRLVEILGDQKVMELYFAKSSKDWASTLSSHCGKSCYHDLVKIGDQLTYAGVDDHETRQSLTSDALDLLAGL